tara:strand:- start:4 stop:273 length:270 start_codon:yes stop_codon:yes gene_type:complete
MNEKEIEQLILNAINMSENPNGKCIHSCDYEELARDIAESLVKKLNLTDVSQQRELCEGKCGMSYCDDNGCIDRKRNLVEPKDKPEHCG